MNADERRDRLNGLSERIIGCGYTVSNTLGVGFLEKVYENALAHELRLNGLHVAQQVPVTVHYKSHIAGEYVADMIVEHQVLVELKACRAFDDVHSAQCLNYLKATGLKLALLMNFGLPHLKVKRLVLDF